MNARIEVKFSGQVQGVGFRYYVSQCARGFAVAGFVQNLATGQVRLVAEGKSSELRQFVEAIVESPPGRVSQLEQTTTRASGEFSGFAIVS